jgi:hypothetical protein
LVGIKFLPLAYRKLEGQNYKFLYASCMVLIDLLTKIHLIILSRGLLSLNIAHNGRF